MLLFVESQGYMYSKTTKSTLDTNPQAWSKKPNECLRMLKIMYMFTERVNNYPTEGFIILFHHTHAVNAVLFSVLIKVKSNNDFLSKILQHNIEPF